MLLDSRSQSLNAGWIALELPLIAKMIKSKIREALVQAQNRAIRSVASKFYSAQLFNYCSVILSRIKKSSHLKLKYFEKPILLNEIRFEYVLTHNYLFTKNGFHTLRKFLPIKLCAVIGEMIIK